MTTNTAREYIKDLKKKETAALKRGEQIDFYDALATGRLSGENAVYWFHPALKKAQAERDELLTAAASDLHAFERIVQLVDDIRNGSDLHNMLDLIFDLASMPAAAGAVAKARGTL